MRILLNLCGGHPDNIELGAGDLYVAVFGGRTRKIGTLLGTGMSFKDAMEALKGVTLESIAIAGRTVEAAKTLESMGVIKADDLPLLYHIGRLLDNETGIDVPWKKFEKEVY
jgi:glycerol-3-phosphate dehydrogenase (NAD(P)+)